MKSLLVSMVRTQRCSHIVGVDEAISRAVPLRLVSVIKPTSSPDDLTATLHC